MSDADARGDSAETPPSELGLGPPTEGSSPGPSNQRPGPPRPPAGIASQATWIAGVAIVLLIAVVTINTISTDSPGSRGIKEGVKAPPFAAPLALANVQCDGQDCDASVAIKARGDSPKACDVRGPDILNSCQLAERGPFVLGFLVGPSQRCIDQIDVLERLKPRFPDVQFAAVAIKGDHAEVNKTIRKHGWTLPVGYDADGAIANTFAVAVCPTITFVKQGGQVGATTLGTATEQEIITQIRKIRSRVPRTDSP